VLKAKLCHLDGTIIVLHCIPLSTSFFSFLLFSDLRPHQTAVINKIVPLKDIQGRVYKFKSRSECLGLGMPTLDVTDVVRSHMAILILEW
jgi:hypothetical protein